MTEADKSTWPKLPSGTIDWETVFEDPAKGLIPLISRAHTANALREMTILVIKKLYARKDDPAEVERFVAQLSEMLPDDTPDQALPKILEAVVAILRQIMNERIRIAETYSKEKALKQETDNQERKSAEKSERRIKHRAHELEEEQERERKTRRIIVIGLSILVVGVIGGAAFFMLQEKSAPTSQEQSLQFIQQMKDAAVKEPSGTHVFGGSLRIGQSAGRNFIAATSVPQEACRSAAWVLLNRGTIVINGVLPSKISPRILKELCEKGGSQASLTWFPKKTDKKE